MTNFNDFSGYDNNIPKKCLQRDSSPGMRYFGIPSGYSPLQRKVSRDFELTPDFTSRGRRPSGMKDPFKSSIF